jgi:hypothetical protein
MKRAIGSVLPLILLLGCGGTSTSNSTPAAISTPQAAPSVALQGLVEGQPGQLVMDGNLLDLGRAQITVDGEAAVAEDIQPGMIVSAEATLQASLATVASLQANTLLRGPVTALDKARLQLTILGKTIQVDAKTLIVQHGDNRTWTMLAFTDLKVGAVLGVCGFAQAGGGIAATRIEVLPAAATAPAGAALSGTIAQLDSAAKTFLLDGTKVDYGSAVLSGTLANGAKASATGTFAGTLFKADHVRVMAVLPPSLPLMLVGPVASLDAAAKTFLIGLMKVAYAGATVDGTLANGVKVSVVGTLSSATPGLVLATQVKVMAMAPPAASWDGVAAGPVTALAGNGAFTVGTSAFWMDAKTVLTSSVMTMSLVAVHLSLGDWVVVAADSAKANAAGAPYAVRVEILPAGAPVKVLAGKVSGFQGVAKTFSLQGFTVQTGTSTSYVVGLKAVDATTFWATSRNAVSAEVDGTPAGALFTAQKIIVP